MGPSDAWSWAGTISVGVIATLLAIQKALNLWTQGTTAINSSQGENQVVTLLRAELERYATQNNRLDSKIVELIQLVDSLRDQNIAQETQMIAMRRQNEKLEADLAAISKQIAAVNTGG
jgi:predicted  nucleic acid-binding Zn-ribbon protein